MPLDTAAELPPVPSDLQPLLDAGGCVVWQEPICIDTYEPADPDELPMFLDRRVYQGSSGKVYPIPFIDRISTEKSPREWQAVHLENRWLRLMVLPELGGRIHVGFDKTAGYDFFYRNDVIKPALVGLAGPWISGGVEFNWPQHHRPATFLPVEISIEQHDDGAVTVWCSDHDPFTRMKGMHGIRLHRDRAVVELVAKLHNRTSDVQTFLWWANVAAAVHDDYQSFFPTDVRYVADHARRAVTAFPAADRPYYGVDYPARAAEGGDRIDFYRNIPVPTSYMVTDTRDDFFGGYDHRANAGFVHVADRHVAPGKKQWTWGNSPFGHAWDRLLTDSNGPYIELMAGVYTDNQPDFAWLEPGETKEFTQTWYPIHRIGPVHQANGDAAVRLEVADDTVTVGVAVTAEQPGARIRLRAGEAVLLDEVRDLAPGRPAVLTLPAPVADAHEYLLDVSVAHRELISWRPRADAPLEEPWTATAPPPPTEIGSVDELYVTGVHLMQYRHPTRSPVPYWEEALRRDPLDSRTNIALADHLYRRGRYADAEVHARRAVDRQTRRNGNPRDGEARYLLGLVLGRQGRLSDAVDLLSRAAWDGRWAAPAHLEIARIHARQGALAAALTAVRTSVRGNDSDSRAHALLVILLRRLNRHSEAAEVLAARLESDPLDQMARHLSGLDVSRNPKTLLDLALELAVDGADDDALHLLGDVVAAAPQNDGNVVPMAHYHRSVILQRAGRSEEARAARSEAATARRAHCFPSGLDDHDALVAVLQVSPDDHVAGSLLGMLLFAGGRQVEALDLWRRAIDAGEADFVTLRNAAIAAVNLLDDAELATTWYDRAIALNPSARLVYERDQLLARSGVAPERRISLLEEHSALVAARDDATVSYCDLLIDVGRAGPAFEIMHARRFAPWEGGEGLALAVWVRAALALSREAAEAGRTGEALELAELALHVPDSLGEARHPASSARDLMLWLAHLQRRLGDETSAELLEAAAAREPVDESSPSAAEPDYFATSLPEFMLFTPAHNPGAETA
jgi:tetratricopeptide (TPR) repeat protein